MVIERPGPVDPNGPCANTIPADDIKIVSFPAGKFIIVKLTGEKYNFSFQILKLYNYIETSLRRRLLVSRKISLPIW